MQVADYSDFKHAAKIQACCCAVASKRATVLYMETVILSQETTPTVTRGVQVTVVVRTSNGIGGAKHPGYCCSSGVHPLVQCVHERPWQTCHIDV